MAERGDYGNSALQERPHQSMEDESSGSWTHRRPPGQVLLLLVHVPSHCTDRQRSPARTRVVAALTYSLYHTPQYWNSPVDSKSAKDSSAAQSRMSASGGSESIEGACGSR
eukprot:scpid88159/ scgid24340/ 